MICKDDTHLIPEYTEWKNKIREKPYPHAPNIKELEELISLTEQNCVLSVLKDEKIITFKTEYLMAFLVATVVAVIPNSIEVKWKSI